MSDLDLKTKIAASEFGLSDLVWWEGQNGWVLLGQSGLIPSPTGPGKLPPLPSAANTPQKISTLAWAAVGLAVVGLIFAPVQIGTIIVGHLALKEIKKTPYLKGRGMVITSLVIGYIYIFIIAACVIIAVSNQIWH